MFRRTLIGSLVATGTLLAPTAAHAAATTTTVVNRGPLPNPLTFGEVEHVACTAPTTGAELLYVIGPKKPPLGKGSLGMKLLSNSVEAISEAPSGKTLPDLTQLSVSSYVPKSSPVVNQLLIDSAPVGSGDYYRLTLTLPKTASWAGKDIFAPSTLMNWQLIDPSSPTPVDSGTATYSDFSSVHSSVGLGSVGVSSANCASGKHSGYFDALTIGIDDTATRYNFEAHVPTKLVSGISTKTIAAGKAVRPKARLTHAGHPLAGRSVALYQKSPGAKFFRKVKTATTNAHGVAKAPVHPRVTKLYRWQYAGGSVFRSAVSSPFKVNVARALTLRLEQASVRSGVPLDASGTLTPKRAGTTVKLWQRHGKATRVLIGKGTVHHDGTYSIARNLPVGHYRIFTTVVKTKTNTAGKSPTRSFVVTGP